MEWLRERAGQVAEEVEDWCRGRSAVLRAPLLLWMAYLALRHLLDTQYTSWFGALNLGIHEGGHLLFSWLSWDFLTVAGGTGLQLAAPLAAAVMFARQPDWFAVSVCGTWLATNLYSVATYVADARAMALPLVTVGSGECFDNCHDWNYLLGTLHLLPLDTTIGFLIRALAFGVAWGSVAAGVFMLRLMVRSR
jgi:hypothetical protein